MIDLTETTLIIDSLQVRVRVSSSIQDKIRVVPRGIERIAEGRDGLQGNVSNPIELASPYSIATTSITPGNYAFKFDVEETRANALEKTGYIFRVNVYANGILRGAFVLGQVKEAENQMIEGVTCIADVGKTSPSIIFILILPIIMPM